jgi:hypothetical protein
MLALTSFVSPVWYTAIHELSLLPFVAPPPKKLYIQAFWTATYKIQSWTHFILLYLDPWTKIRQIH